LRQKGLVVAEASAEGNLAIDTMSTATHEATAKQAERPAKPAENQIVPGDFGGREPLLGALGTLGTCPVSMVASGAVGKTVEATRLRESPATTGWVTLSRGNDGAASLGTDAPTGAPQR
jgi:hypothetical protein